jgi:hypothetical protein
MKSIRTKKEDSDVNQNIIDTELVEIAGLHAYREMNRRDSFFINGKRFKVIHVIKDSETGLDAFTVQNTITKDYTIVYVGTDPKSIEDIKTDLKLLRDTPPAQLEKGLEYFDNMVGEYGPISSVSGNSLGGGVANYVAVERPEVKAVTLNPAPLPSGAVDPNATYDNMTNYVSQYDVLTLGMGALGYGNRIPKNYNDDLYK